MNKTMLRDYALYVRSKNAGPFCLTFEIFLKNKSDYDRLVAMNLVTPELISALYGPAPESVQIFFCEDIYTIKISVPRPVVQGSLKDKDIHAGQQSVLLANVEMDGAAGHDPHPKGTPA